jgi:uncharacterized membrane-anchored protein
MDATLRSARPFPVRAELELHHELHARPALPARSPCVVSYWTHWCMTPEVAEAAIAVLCLSSGAPAPSPGTRHHVLHTAGFALKFERHGEFVSWQVSRPLVTGGSGASGAGFVRGIGADELSDEWLRHALLVSRASDGLPDAFVDLLRGEGGGEMIAATHVVLIDAAGADDLLPRCRSILASELGAQPGDDASPVMGSYVGDAGRAALLTHLRLGIDGFTRFVLLDFGMPPDQAAREAQRLCEIEAYRMLAMLGFPVAQQESALLAGLEQQLLRAVDSLANDHAPDDRGIFETLTSLAAEVEHSTARSRYRFSATRAYHRVVERRLSDLREQRIEGLQTVSGFLSRRFAPAMGFCDSTDARLTDMADRISRAVALARVRVEVRREADNQHLLAALAHRQGLQLRLQQTVEGLSVVAISYYALAIVGDIARAMETVPWFSRHEIAPDTVVGVMVVPVVVAVAAFIRRLHRQVTA